jgi:hypothetical protein
VKTPANNALMAKFPSDDQEVFLMHVFLDESRKKLLKARLV